MGEQELKNKLEIRRVLNDLMAKHTLALTDFMHDRISHKEKVYSLNSELDRAEAAIAAMLAAAGGDK